MIKSNSLTARNNIKKFILNNFNFEDHPEVKKDFNEVKTVILKSFNNYISESDKTRPLSSVFYDWGSGLPNVLSFDDVFLGCDAAINVLGDILEETESEKKKYTESEAEKTLCNLIYRELVK